ncbi:MAG: AAA family ATPase, partial [Candidatus Bipolaricaulota bacterium]|nr:AAA family ATPase [Candidatus Bipolaricaulota bacterium]
MSALMEAPDDQISGLTPEQVVVELDKYIVGQTKAKRAVAIALRNRLRCQYVEDEMRFEIKPKNILMIGPTGVGKTEISRRLARLTTCPFVKVEATKFTEVGYVGRDVETMVRDLVDTAIDMIREDEILRVEDEAERTVVEEILNSLLPTPAEGEPEKEESAARTREKLREKLEAGELEERYIEITVEEPVMPQIEVFSQDGMDQMGIDMGDVLSGLLPPSRKKKKMRIREARSVLFEQVVD